LAECKVTWEDAVDPVGYNTDYSIQLTGISYDEWHTFRIEVEPETAELFFFLDDQLWGNYLPGDVWRTADAKFQLNIGAYWEQNTSATSYVDNVFISNVSGASPPSPTSTPTGICDDFDDSSIQSYWNWVDPSGDSSYSLSDRPGFLRITVHGRDHDLYQNLNAPRLLRFVDGDFVATTNVSINPLVNYQGAGLLFWQDEYNYVRLERTLVRGIDLLYRIQGTYNAVEIPFSASTVYLKFEMIDQELSSFYSEDGFNWIEVDTLHILPSEKNQVGIAVVNEWQDASISADFDFFKLGECQ